MLSEHGHGSPRHNVLTDEITSEGICVAITLLVADGGGHLTQLVKLAPRLVPIPDPVVWVTHDTTQTRGLLADQVVVPAHHPTTRNVRNAVANLALAQRLFDRYEVVRVVTTGAGLAPPFAALAARHKVPLHYIETATRVKEPSLSGRLVERLSNVRCYTQHPGWDRRGWLFRGSVLDGYVVEPQRVTIGHVFVSLGTHRYSFQRLVSRLEATIPDGVAVTWQLGSTTPPPNLRGSYHDFLPALEQERLMAEADVVVGHAGMGFAVAALDAGKVPVLVPREPDFGEHVDDHQVRLAHSLNARGLAVAVSVDELVWTTLKRASRQRAISAEPHDASFNLAEA